MKTILQSAITASKTIKSDDLFSVWNSLDENVRGILSVIIIIAIMMLIFKLTKNILGGIAVLVLFFIIRYYIFDVWLKQPNVLSLDWFLSVVQKAWDILYVYAQKIYDIFEQWKDMPKG